MNKSALKNFATAARKELLKKVEAKALKIGITENSIKKAQIESSDAIFIDGRQLSKEEKIQRNKLIDRTKQIGFGRVLDEVAYTWFNRFTALRFMEVNDYLPTKVRVLSSANLGSTEPDMLKEALSLDLDLDKELVYELKLNNQTEELFKYLIIKHCNDLNRYMPFMFETIDDYTEILFPEGLLATDSFIRQMTDTTAIPEDNWSKIEVIGWLYQYYIAEEKDRVFKAKAKYKAEEIPYATQLFTPDWIVQYMVQNSLGRYWIEAHPEHRDLLAKWEFYLENPNPEPDLEKKLAPYINRDLKVEDIKCFDPAMGSGHILVYMFEVLYEIYSKCGYMDREIPRLIIENNLYGLDIDDRAYQLACFSVVMKALEYNKRFLRSIEREPLTLNLASIQETNILTTEDIVFIAGESNGEKYTKTKEFLEQFHDAKTIGSLLKINTHGMEIVQKRVDDILASPATDLFHVGVRDLVLSLLPLVFKQACIMSNRYDILVTNPPYMGSGNMNLVLSGFLKKNYPDSKADLFAAFMEADHYMVEKGLYANVNQQSWMFLSSFEKLREKVIKTKCIDSMLHLGPRAFEEIGGEVVQSTAFILRNAKVSGRRGTYLRLIEERTAIEKRGKAIEGIQSQSGSYRYSFDQEDYKRIPGSPIAYWASNIMVKVFNNEQLGIIASPKRGLCTCANDKFYRAWTEINFLDIGYTHRPGEKFEKKWIPLNKGGEFRKWYGNLWEVVDWEDNGRNLRAFPPALIKNEDCYFFSSITWSSITSGDFSVRCTGEGFIFDQASNGLFPENGEFYYIAGILNSKVTQKVLNLINPSLNVLVGDIAKIPIIYDESKKESIDTLVLKCIEISKQDWDSFENSWDFQKHPLILGKGDKKISLKYKDWANLKKIQFNELKLLEENINKIIIDMYDLYNELSPEVDESEITLRKAELERDIKSFISYAFGCMFGRYSLDEEGLIFAGGKFDPTRYKTFSADKDNILPILPGAYFEDDIVSKFVEFVRVTFGEETLAENLDFVADALGKKNGETAKETIRRYFMNDFYKDHVQTYKKRPIYWLFTSGKEKAFNCLIYMHRYDKSTLSRIRTDYLHEYQIRLDAEKTDLQGIIDGNSSAAEISKARKALTSLEKKITELRAYDEMLHHMADMQIEIDLDDGVVVNYEKFKGLVAPL